MNDLQQSLLDAMEILADAAEKNSKRTKTIECTIIDNSQAGAGIYQANYLGNIIQVYSGNLTSSYAIGEVVNVLVPEGNFDKDKSILGSVRSGSNLINTGAVTSSQSYVTAGSNLLESILTENEYFVTTWKIIPGTHTGSYHKTYKLNSTFYNKIKNYRSTGLQQYKLTANIKSAIEQAGHTSIRGDYGITIYLPKLPTDSEPSPAPATITLSTNEGIDGTIFNFPTYTTRSSVTSLDSSITLDPNDYGEIDFWAEGFYIEEEIEDPVMDVSFKNISLEPVSKVDNNEYTLTIGGNLEINKNEDYAQPTAKLMYQGVEVEADCYFWFIYNINGDNNNIPEAVKKYVNNDYDYIENDSDGNFIINPTSTIYYNNNSIKIPKEKFLLSTSIKCVAVYGNTPYIADALLTNEEMLNHCDFIIKTETGMSAFPNKGIINIQTILTDTAENNNLIKYGAAGVQYVFAYYSTSGVIDKLNTLENNENSSLFTRNYVNKQEHNSLISSVGIKAEDIDNGYCIIKCSAFFIPQTDLDGVTPILIKTVTLPINISEELTYSVIAENANVIYKYDKDGDSPTSGSAYNSNGKVDNIKPITIKIYNKNGSEISNNQYDNLEVKYRVSKNNLYKDLFVTEDGINKESLKGSDYLELTVTGQKARKLYYTIQDKFSAANNENEIEITVTYDNNVFKIAAPIMFIKEGENGVNATKYIGYICLDENIGTNEDYSYEQKDIEGNIHKLNLCHTNNDWYYSYHNKDTWKKVSNGPGSGFKFQLKIYQDGGIYHKSQLVVKWYIFKGTVFEDQTNEVLYISKDNIVNLAGQILCAEYTIDGLTLTNYYSFDYITINTDEVLTDQPVISYDYGFNNVLYEADGGQPSYNSSLKPMINFGYGNDYTLYNDVLKKWDDTISDPFQFDIGNGVGLDINNRYFKPTSKITTPAFITTTHIGITFGDSISNYFSRYENTFGNFTEYYDSISPEFNYDKIDEIWNNYYIQAYDCYHNGLDNLKQYIKYRGYFINEETNNDRLKAEFKSTIALYISDMTPKNYTQTYILNNVFANKFKLINRETTIEKKYTQELIDNYLESTRNAGSEYEKLTRYLDIKDKINNNDGIYNKKTINFYKSVIFNYNQHDLGSVEGYNGNTSIKDLNTVAAGTGNTSTGIYMGRSGNSNVLCGYNGVKRTFCLDGNHGTLTVASDPDFEVNTSYIKMGEIGMINTDDYGTIFGAANGDTSGGGGKGSKMIHLANYNLWVENKEAHDGTYIKTNWTVQGFYTAIIGPGYTEENARDLIEKGNQDRATIVEDGYDIFYLAKSSKTKISGNALLSFENAMAMDDESEDYKGAEEYAMSIKYGSVGIGTNPNNWNIWAGYTKDGAMFAAKQDKVSFAQGKAYIDNSGNFISGNCELNSIPNFGSNPVLVRGWVNTNKGVAALDGNNKYLVLP